MTPINPAPHQHLRGHRWTWHRIRGERVTARAGIFAMRTTAISLVISHSACGVQRTRARRIYRPVLDSFSFILFSLVPLLAFPPSAFNSFFYQPSSSGPFLSFFIALAPVLSLYIQPVDPTSVLRTTSNRPRPGHCASAPLGASSLSSELFIPHANPVAPSNSVPRCAMWFSR